ncbi:MAG: DUF86 domain-containing protein [Nitrospinae bacterium]|nr:DUF86 domain-containing protein [Nitrospinota bacterium]
MLDEHPEFAARYPDVPWKQIRGMRDRMARGYFEINLDIVWDTSGPPCRNWSAKSFPSSRTARIDGVIDDTEPSNDRPLPPSPHPIGKNESIDRASSELGQNCHSWQMEKCYSVNRLD